MTVLAVRYETGGRRRFERRDQSRLMQLEQLRDRIERGDYAVDPEKVADAIVRRLGRAQPDIGRHRMDRWAGPPPQ